MFRVLTCLTAEHDPRLVVLAGIVCFLASVTAPDILPRIFEPLFSSKNFGTGFGLPTVKQLVEQHRGTISIDSTPSQGAGLPFSNQQSMAA